MNYSRFFILAGLVLVLGSLFTGWSARDKDRRMRREIITEGRMVAQAVNWALTEDLAGSSVDLENEDYLRLKARLTLVREANPRYRFLYLMGKKPDGTVFFFVDSEDPESGDYSPPGQEYPEATQLLHSVFGAKQEAAEGPVTDQWGTWVSSLIRIDGTRTGEPVGVFGMDVAARTWRRDVLQAAVLPAAVTILICIVLLAAALILKKDEQARGNFETFFNFVPELLFVLDDSGNILHMNWRSLARLGIREADGIGRPFLDFFPPSRHPELEAFLSEVSRGLETVSRVPLLGRDGRLISVETRGSRGLWNRRPARFLVSKDVSRIKQSEERFARAFNSSAVAMSVTRFDNGRFMEVNEMFCASLGYSREELIGRTSLEMGVFADPEDRRRLQEALRERRPPRNVEVFFKNKAGEEHPALFSADLIEVGNEQCILSVLTDITEYKRIEDSLRDAFARSQRCLDAIASVSICPHLAAGAVGDFSRFLTEAAAASLGVERAGVWLFDAREEELFCIDLFEATPCRHSSGTVLKRSQYRNEFEYLRTAKYLDAHDALTDPRAAGYVENYLKPLGIVSMLDAVIRTAGRNLGVLCLEQTGETRHWQPDEIGFVCQLADQVAMCKMNSERLRARDARIEVEKKILQIQKYESLGLMAGAIAHDFNNLLSAILGNLELASLALPRSSTLRPHLESALGATRRATDLTKQMLAYSGKGAFISEKLDLNTLLVEEWHIIRSSVSPGLDLNVRPAPNLPPVLADADQVRQALLALVANAAEALGTEVGTITISSGSVECGETYLSGSRLEEMPPPGRFVWLEVSDTGCGMDPTTSQRMFEPFFSRKFTGRGLGLAAVLGIIRGHGGAIMVDTAPDRGTSVRMLFPALEQVEATGPVLKAPEKAGEGRRELRGTVLLVDDEAFVREVGEQMLRHLGLDVLTAPGGREALEIYGIHSPDVSCVLLDLTMPGMDGSEVFRALREINPDIRIVLMSGYDEKDALGRLGEDPPAGFLHKPYDLENLRTLLGQVLAS